MGRNVLRTLCLFQALDEMDVEEFRHGGANITGFRLINTTSVLTSRAVAPTISFRWQPASESRTTISVYFVIFVSYTVYALQLIGHESDLSYS